MLLLVEFCCMAAAYASAWITSAAATSNCTAMERPQPHTPVQGGGASPGLPTVRLQLVPTWLVMLRGMTLEASAGAKPRAAAAHVMKVLDGTVSVSGDTEHSCAELLTS